MTHLQISWNPSPYLYKWDHFTLYFYSLFFAVGLIFFGILIYSMLDRKGIPYTRFRTLFFYVFIGSLLGARIGHCLFYEPGYYLYHFHEIFLPFRYENGTFLFTGFHGLASHGGIIGLIVSVWLFCRKYKYSFLFIGDMVCVAGPILAGFIRLGNLMNSEIIGIPISAPWGVIFERIDTIPRHPAQLYEAMAYFILFALNYSLYKNGYKTGKPGFYTGFSMCYVFIFRFLIEFIKENQVPFESSIPLNMGQWLSLPFIVAGIYIITRKGKTSPIP